MGREPGAIASRRICDSGKERYGTVEARFWPIAEWLLRAIEMEKRSSLAELATFRSAKRLFFLEVRRWRPRR
jgi:hypothetical protein